MAVEISSNGKHSITGYAPGWQKYFWEAGEEVTDFFGFAEVGIASSIES